MNATTVRIPSVGDTVRRYLLRSLVGDEVRWVRGLLWLPAIGLLILAVPRVDSHTQWPMFYVFFVPVCAIHAVTAARREHEFGGPRRLVVVAGVTTFLASLGLLLTFVALSINIGPERGSSAIEALGALVPPNLLLGGLLLIVVALAAAYWINDPARKRVEARDRERIRAERLARGKAVRP